MDSLEDVLDAVRRLGQPNMHITDKNVWFVQLNLYSNSPQAKVVITNSRSSITDNLKIELEFVLAEAVRTIHTFEFGKPKGPEIQVHTTVDTLTYANRLMKAMLK